MNVSCSAIGIFALFVLSTLGITVWASARVRTAAQFYAADGSISPWQNGLAIAGDYLSAASFLGTISVFFNLGIDGLLYAVGAASGWPIATCLVAERLRTLGRYTLADVLCARFDTRTVRAMTAIATFSICGSYLVSQIVGAGILVQVFFGIPYDFAVVVVGLLMTLYVMFGGMVATTWIQLAKAAVLMTMTVLMAFLVVKQFGFSLDVLITEAALTRSDPQSFLNPAGLLTGPFDGVGLALAFLLGPAGMPHILMRFFTVPDAPSARRSLVLASLLITLFQILVIVLGIGAMALVSGEPAAHDSQGHLIGGANMAAIHLANRLGGDTLFAIVSAVTFATILAVVSGLTLASASALSHDLYRQVVCKDQHLSERSEIRVFRLATVAIGGVTIGAGLLFRDQNIGFLATLPLVIAASSTFPILLLALYWRRLSAAGAVAGGLAGLGVAISLVTVSPKVWVGVLGHSVPLFPYEYPTAISLGSALLTAWVVSLRAR